jgi:hypothetical protein
VRGIDIRQMSKGDVDEASRLIATAFADNPNTLAVTRGDRAKAQRIIQAGVRVAKLGRKCGDGRSAASSTEALETDVDKNVLLYERFGFRVVSQADFEGVNNRFMWREARGRSS